ncbi:MAG TPA: pyridoxamine 5'-phosphate oxidase family protein [Chthoniobacteraceae bacterium]|nr:pyridoxamine 5'-phosphate oxidase family protein [Chthoniobacteraceae bacterium]
MAARFRQQVLTPAVRAAQERYFGHCQIVENAPTRDLLNAEEATFIATRDSFYLASVNSDDWPYIQHRGGPPGFLKVLESNLLGFADLKGNRQLLSTGNIDGNDRVALFLMDYPHRERLKILGRARVLDARENPDLADKLSPDPKLRDQIERLFVIEVVSFDWNCPQYITPRYTLSEMEEVITPLKARIAELEALLDGRTG